MTLVIDYIEIENFKSYYGKNILGPFHQSFNAVIGPNGSGKSNVIDSLLFVFGFRAQKIRTKKISVLIHNSDQHQNVNSCSVNIFFKKIRETSPNTWEVIPNSNFTVKRTAYKDNSSDYYIDDRRVQYKEVGALLRECGVDLDHNRFLILQGEVESISLLKPKAANEHEEGLLEYLEDIIGTLRFKPLLESVAAEIDKVNEIRTEKANRVNNLQKDKNSLEGPKNEAINFLKKENELIETKNLYYQLKLHEIKKIIEEREEGRVGLDKDLEELNTKLAEFNKENEEVTSAVTAKKKEYEKKSKLKEKLKKKYEDFEKEDVEIREGIKHAQEQIKKLQRGIDTETEKMKTYAEVPAKNEQRIEELQLEIKETEAKLEPANAELQAKMEKANVETKKLQEKKSEHTEKLTELQNAVNEAKSHMDIAQSELDAYLQNQTYEEKKLKECREKLEELVARAQERDKGIKELERSLPKMEAEYKRTNDEYVQVQAREKKLAEQVHSERQRFSEAQSSFSSNKNRNRVIQFLMQLKSEGRLDGLYGRLGDLGAIDEKYDAAVSTACGALDNIVVDTIETAQECIGQLRRHNMGTATFIALDKQDKWREHLERRAATPENVPRLVDLIKVNDERLLNVFYYSLRNTLVAENLDQASRIAYGAQRNRVVTLKGEIIEVSGTMSGGGAPMRGRMGSRLRDDFSPEQIRQLQESVQDHETELRELQARRQQLEPLVYELKKKLDEAQANAASWRDEAGPLQEQIAGLRKAEANSVKRLKEVVLDEATQRRMEASVERHRGEYERADKVAAKVRAEVDELHERIVEVGKRLLGETKARIKSLEEQAAEASAQITALNVEIKSSKRNMQNAEKKLAGLREDIETNEASLAKFEARLGSMDAEGAQLIEQHEAAKVECAELERDIADMAKKNKQLESKQQALEAERIDLNHKLEKLREELEAHEHESRRYENALRALKLHNIAELESLTPVTQNADESTSQGAEMKRYEEDDLTGADAETIARDIHKLEENLKSQTPNLSAIQSFREMQIKFMERVAELETVTNQRDKLCSDFEDLRKQRLDEFMGGFTAIRLKLKEIYRTVTLEGDAELELVDSLDPFTEGIVLSVRPPKKSWKNVSNLSGGEKTLSSLSLVFALHEFRATPIYVMDEIDAALDFKNVSIIAHYIKERTKNAQFIIISLRNNMFELCDRLFGIYKVKNCTSATYIAPELIELEDKKDPKKKASSSASSGANGASNGAPVMNGTSSTTAAQMISAS